MLIASLSTLLIIFFLIAFGFVKIIHDTRMRLLKDARELFDEHFLSVEKLSSDPATPPELYALVVAIGERSVNDEGFGRNAAEQFLKGSSDATEPPNEAAREIFARVEELEKHRPDLAFSFKKAAAAGVFASAFRHIAHEMSPLRAYREAKAARDAQRASNSKIISHVISSIEPAHVSACVAA